MFNNLKLKQVIRENKLSKRTSLMIQYKHTMKDKCYYASPNSNHKYLLYKTHGPYIRVVDYFDTHAELMIYLDLNGLRIGRCPCEKTRMKYSPKVSFGKPFKLLKKR